MEQERGEQTWYHSDEEIVDVYETFRPELIVRSRNAGLSHHDAEDLVQICAEAIVRMRNRIDDSTDSLMRYARTTYTHRRTDLYRLAWSKHVSLTEPGELREDNPFFNKKSQQSAEEDYFEQRKGELVAEFFSELLDPENTLLTDGQRVLLSAYLQTQNWRKACEMTGSSVEHNAAKSRGRRLLKKIVELEQQGEIEYPA